MSRRKRILSTVLVVAILGAIGFKICNDSKKKTAIQVARDYLSDKYVAPMDYVDVRFSWIDPAIYHVAFSPSEKLELRFEVIVQRDLILSETVNEHGHFIPDNYYLQFFRLEIENRMQPAIAAIWSEDATIVAPPNNQPLYSYKVSVELNEQMTMDEIEPHMDYDFSIKTKVLLDSASKESEAYKIWELIQNLQSTPYRPKEIRFWYLTGKDEKGRVATDSNTWPEMYINFGNWVEITDAQQVERMMDEQWFTE